MSEEEISMEEQPLCSHRITEIPIKFEPLKQEKYKYSEEEKKAIEYLVKYKDDIENRRYEADLTWNICILLNLIEKYKEELELKDKEIEKLKMFQCNAKCMKRYKL